MLTSRPASQGPAAKTAPPCDEPRFWQLPPEPPAPVPPGAWRQTSQERYLGSADSPKGARGLQDGLDAALKRYGVTGWSIEVRHISRPWPQNDVWYLYAVSDAAEDATNG